MSSDRFSAAFTSAGLALLALTACSEPERGRTVLLVSLDSVRADTLTFDDPRTSPRLAQLAEQGTVFDQAVAASSWTLPSHVTMFTGAPPQLHGVEYDDIAIDASHATLPELLAADGWFTAGWWTGWFLSGEYGFERGFNIYENAMTGGREIEAQYRDALARGDLDEARAILGGREVLGHQDITSVNVADALVATVEAVETDQDLFLFAHLFDPHYDYVPPEPFDTHFDADYTGTIDGRNFYNNPRIFDLDAVPRRRISDRDLEHVRALYRGEVAWTDSQIGRMLDALEAAGRLDDALVIVTSDHGEEFFEHGNRGHRQGLHDEVLRVPLLVRAPDSAAGPAAVVGAQVGLGDLLPTITEFAGLEAPTTSRGRSLLGAARGGPASSEPQLSSLMQYSTEHGYLFMDSLRLPDEKLIRTLGLRPDGSLKVLRSEYYDLGADPGELRPVLGPDNQQRPIWSQLEARSAQLRQLWAAASPSPRMERRTRIAEVFEGDLGALGYADGAPEEASPGLSLPWPPGPRPPARYEPRIPEVDARDSGAAGDG